MEFENFMKEIKLSQQQIDGVIEIIKKYSEKCNEDTHRYHYEAEMEEIDNQFRNSQLAELALKYFKDDTKDSKAVLLFQKIYGDMPKYKY